MSSASWVRGNCDYRAAWAMYIVHGSFTCRLVDSVEKSGAYNETRRRLETESDVIDRRNAMLSMRNVPIQYTTINAKKYYWFRAVAQSKVRRNSRVTLHELQGSIARFAQSLNLDIRRAVRHFRQRAKIFIQRRGCTVEIS